MRTFFIISLVMSLLMGCSAATSENVHVVEHIEVYTIERYVDFPNSDGYDSWEVEGYDKVNAITRHEESSKSGSTTKLYVVTDSYMNDGTFIKSTTKYEEYRRSTDYTDTKEEITFEPLTILSEDTVEPFGIKELSEDEKTIVKEHVLNLVETLE